MPNKIHCGNCGISNKPSCYHDCPIKKSNDEDSHRLNHYKDSPMFDYYKDLHTRIEKRYFRTGRSYITG